MREDDMDLPPLPMRLACAKVGATRAAMVTAMTLAVVRKEVLTVCFLKINSRLENVCAAVAGKKKFTKHSSGSMRNKP
ncbi:MAG: hypothetical protein JWR74_2339 [Polaromonas sp.]|jgi:hypothetical protein|nr:hypothetical protein [Polaromonas sp.]